ncbi:MAG: ferrous iron transport protein A [Firmicutes bacterium]|nr:ferrous iron transport protein A [Bacillota bacterium]
MAVNALTNTYTPSGHFSLAELPVHTKARICSLADPTGKDLQKLLVFGLLPGRSVEILQRYPAIVVQVGRTTIALDEQVAAKVIVKV